MVRDERLLGAADVRVGPTLNPRNRACFTARLCDAIIERADAVRGSTTYPRPSDWNGCTATEARVITSMAHYVFAPIYLPFALGWLTMLKVTPTDTVGKISVEEGSSSPLRPGGC